MVRMAQMAPTAQMAQMAPTAHMAEEHREAADHP
jgi:hypothetical protein